MTTVRADDNYESFLKRLKVMKQETQEVVDQFKKQSKLLLVDAQYGK